MSLFLFRKKEEINLATTKTKKNKGGRPSKKADINFDIARKLAERGLTMQEIADILSIDRATLYRWRADEKFCDALKKGRDFADERVVVSLYERCIGYSHPDTHITNYQGKVTKTPIIKYYPPDPTSMIFWLKNRQPEQWKDRVPEGAGSERELVEQELEFKSMPKGKNNGRFQRYYN